MGLQLPRSNSATKGEFTRSASEFTRSASSREDPQPKNHFERTESETQSKSAHLAGPIRPNFVRYVPERSPEGEHDEGTGCGSMPAAALSLLPRLTRPEYYCEPSV